MDEGTGHDGIANGNGIGTGHRNAPENGNASGIEAGSGNANGHGNGDAAGSGDDRRSYDGDEYELAELNIGRILAPLDTPQLADFVGGLKHINALADAAPGFVWRLQDDESDGSTSIRIFDDDWILVNMSVWQSPETLRAFVYDDAHRSYLRRRREWFERLTEAVTVLWWVPSGHRPTVAEARERLEHLRKHGVTEYAFALHETFPAPPPGADYTPHD